MNPVMELLVLEDKRWSEFCDKVNSLSDLEQPLLANGWSGKDLLAHVAAWHALTCDRLEQFRVSAAVPEPPVVDDFNEQTYRGARDISLHDVLAMSGAARHRFLEEVALLDPDLSVGLQDLIAGNAHAHYEEHLPDLDAALEDK